MERWFLATKLSHLVCCRVGFSVWLHGYVSAVGAFENLWRLLRRRKLLRVTCVWPSPGNHDRTFALRFVVGISHRWLRFVCA